MIRHHPTDETLAFYAGGTLSEALGLVVATHLAGCVACRRIKSELEAVGGEAMDDMPPTPMDDDALALVLARTERPFAPALRPVLSPHLPPPLDACDFDPWRRIGLGLRWRGLKNNRRGLAGLLEGLPGKVLPLHAHSGLELTCVLSGTFTDGAAQYGAGDLAEVEAGHEHRPTIGGDSPCLCVVATEGVQLRGLLGVAQRLVTR